MGLWGKNSQPAVPLPPPPPGSPRSRPCSQAPAGPCRALRACTWAGVRALGHVTHLAFSFSARTGLCLLWLPPQSFIQDTDDMMAQLASAGPALAVTGRAAKASRSLWSQVCLPCRTNSSNWSSRVSEN